MRATPTGQSEYHNGNEVGRYARTDDGAAFVWYHCGLRSVSEPAWAMDTDVVWKISVSVDTIYVVATKDPDATVYAIERDAFENSTEELDGREQCVARASDEFVHEVGDPNDHLNGNLWIESGNQVDEGYHKQANEA